MDAHRKFFPDLKITKMSLSKDDAIKLLGSYLSILPSRWQGLQTYIAIYITLVTGIFSLLLASLKLSEQGATDIYIGLGTILIWLLSQFAKITIKKQNQHIKELIVVIAKLELEIGLYDLKMKEHSNIQLWKGDEYFITPKWVNDRIKSGNSSTDFILNFQGSSAKFAYYIFICFQAISIILLTYIFYKYLVG